MKTPIVITSMPVSVLPIASQGAPAPGTAADKDGFTPVERARKYRK
ncbi:MAG TPA: hypothetical protein VH639_23475 [Bryobacteraceae bacterium]